MRFFINVLLISLLFGLAGCSEYHKQLLIEDLPEYTPDANEGFLIGSFAYEARDWKSSDLLEKYIDKIQKRGISFDVFARGIDNRDVYGDIVHSKSSFLSNNKIRVDFDIPSGKGQFFIVPLPAGKYQLYSWGSYFGNATLHGSIKEPYNKPFEIKPNEVVYTGQIKVLVFYSDFFKLFFPEYAIIGFEDQYERDYPEIKERFNFIENCPIEILDYGLEMLDPVTKE